MASIIHDRQKIILIVEDSSELQALLEIAFELQGMRLMAKVTVKKL